MVYGNTARPLEEDLQDIHTTCGTLELRSRQPMGWFNEQVYLNTSTTVGLTLQESYLPYKPGNPMLGLATLGAPHPIGARSAAMAVFALPQ